MDDGQPRRNAYDGLRTFIDQCREIGELKDIKGAHWELEAATLTEAVSELIPEPPAILFDELGDYPAGFRVLSLPIASKRRIAMMWGAPLDTPKVELARILSAKLRDANENPIPRATVETGPVMENVKTGDDVDLTVFPVLKCHAQDGGRYIGTGDTVINRDPESGFINVGTYRIQMHGPNLLGLWMAPGQHGQQICQRWWDQGKNCPIVVTFGGDPMIFMASSSRFAWGQNEFDVVGGMRGEPVEVIEGPVTGLPFPAHAEIVIEGEAPPPDKESHPEGPFGEWTGYYAGGSANTGGRPLGVIHVKALYHRNDPILLNMAPQWVGAPNQSVRLISGVLWEQMEAAGVPDIAGVYIYHHYLVVVSIKQRYAGHARQAGMAAFGCAANALIGKYIVVVDEDIDPANIQEVVWAMETRVDPATDIQVIEDAWTSWLEPMLSPEKRAAGDRTMARAIFYAVRPYHWKDTFPRVNRAPRDAMRKVMEKYRSERLPFPKA